MSIINLWLVMGLLCSIWMFAVLKYAEHKVEEGQTDLIPLLSAIYHIIDTYRFGPLFMVAIGVLLWPMVIYLVIRGDTDE